MYTWATWVSPPRRRRIPILATRKFLLPYVVGQDNQKHKTHAHVYFTHEHTKSDNTHTSPTHDSQPRTPLKCLWSESHRDSVHSFSAKSGENHCEGWWTRVSVPFPGPSQRNHHQRELTNVHHGWSIGRAAPMQPQKRQHPHRPNTRSQDGLHKKIIQKQKDGER